jgi:hypothetical protein
LPVLLAERWSLKFKEGKQMARIIAVLATILSLLLAAGANRSWI